MILLVELAHMMIRILVEYFSIVRRSAAWASRESASASLMMTTAGWAGYRLFWSGLVSKSRLEIRQETYL